MNCLRNLLFVLLSSQLVVVGCNKDEGRPNEALPANSYQYTAYDLDGHIVASGTLSLTFEGAAIVGTREIKGTGLEAGSGSITGVLQSDNTVQIELNPGSAALVILKGKFDEYTLVGDRLLDTGAPPMARKIGIFVATQAVVGFSK